MSHHKSRRRRNSNRSAKYLRHHAQRRLLMEQLEDRRVLAGLVNGSFENSTGGLPDDWNPTGNVQVVTSQGETDAAHSLAFSFGNLPSNGVISQTFNTVAGTAHKLSFDFGKYSINQPSQSASLDVDVFDGAGFGGAHLLDQTVIDVTPGSGDANSTDSSDVYSNFEYFFFATSALTTLRFSDTSDPQVAGGGFDAMLDNVKVESSASIPAVTVYESEVNSPTTQLVSGWEQIDGLQTSFTLDQQRTVEVGGIANAVTPSGQSEIELRLVVDGVPGPV
ncbi:hypothetical protein, partial [Novipirellula rosea]|uniref:hypothetical protein n=1 Tax=Novipirellula rosea TaxID=1031540 RepID=UPI0031EB9FED